MNGAQALIKTLFNSGIDTCFMNPGTSEMHFVAALDSVPEMKPVLALFEGVAAGAADGYFRIAGKPAAVLLHLGPGLGNAFANLHNAKRAKSAIINIVGDHATYHKRYDAPLESDIASLASGISKFYRMSLSTQLLALDAVDAIKASMAHPRGISTLVLPADISWNTDANESQFKFDDRSEIIEESFIKKISSLLGENTAILLGGRALSERGLVAARKNANKTKTKILAETFPATLQRGGSIPPVERLGYLAEFMQVQLQKVTTLILVEATAPVSFFAYPNKPSYLVPDDCKVIEFTTYANDPTNALENLADYISADDPSFVIPDSAPAVVPDGELTSEKLAHVFAKYLTAGSIVSDESNTAGIFLSGATAQSEPHSWMCLTGGAIGQGLPLATGAAVAAKDRQVFALQADGSAMYTIQALWTQARENLKVTNIILDNRSYAVLEMELNRVGADPPGPKAKSMLNIGEPDMNFVDMASGMGVAGMRVSTCEDFAKALEKAANEDGPYLIHAILPKGMF
jgi:acetolactate synthase-1/2/3 large subunit